MAEQTIFVNETEILNISDNNYTNTIIQALVGPEGKAGPEGPQGPPGPRGPRGRAAPFFPRTVFASYALSLDLENNSIPVINATWIKLSSTLANNVTGIGAGTEGELRILTNVGSNNIVIKHNDSTAINDQKILTNSGQNIVLNPNNSISLIYDQTSQKWRVVSVGIGV